MKKNAGYTLVEALVAAAILIIAIAAAVTLTLTMTAQEESNHEFSRAINFQEQAARLYQLGLSPTAISQILPPDPVVESLSFDVSETSLSGIGTVEGGTCTVVMESDSPQLDGHDPVDSRTIQLTIVRPFIRGQTE